MAERRLFWNNVPFLAPIGTDILSPANGISLRNLYWPGFAFFRVGFLVSLWLLIGCSAGLKLENYISLRATPERFSVCHGYGCVFRTPASLTQDQWEKVLNLFQQPASDAKSERRKVAKAIALMELFVGEMVGTSLDKGGAAFIYTDSGQMDCIDETVNSSLYLNFLETAGLLFWHEVAPPGRRGFFLDGKWPHNTAVLKEKETGNLYAVDSWFFENGEEPAIVSLQEWLGGWKP